jgi:hypothetical protein
MGNPGCRPWQNRPDAVSGRRRTRRHAKCEARWCRARWCRTSPLRWVGKFDARDALSPHLTSRHGARCTRLRSEPVEHATGLGHDATDQLFDRGQFGDLPYDLTRGQNAYVGAAVDQRRLGHHRCVGGHDHLWPR